MAAAALSACANLKAVRDFTGSSAQLTGYTDVTKRYLGGQDRIAAEIPRAKEFDQDRKEVAQLATKTAAQRDTILKLHNVATGYMAALAKLAGEESFNISKQIDEVTGAIVAAPDLGLNEAHVKAFGSIAKTVSSWILAARQAREVKALVKDYGEPMDKLLEGMEFVAGAMSMQLVNERDKIKAYFSVYEAAYLVDAGPELQATGNERAVLLQRREVAWRQLRRSHAAMLADSQAAVDSAALAVEGIKTVRAGHSAMRRNVDDLSGEAVAALLERAAADLKSIRDNLKKL